MMQERIGKRNPFTDAANILNEFGQFGNKTKAMRQFTIQAQNYLHNGDVRSANIMRVMKKKIKYWR